MTQRDASGAELLGPLVCGLCGRDRLRSAQLVLVRGRPPIVCPLCSDRLRRAPVTLPAPLVEIPLD